MNMSKQERIFSLKEKIQREGDLSSSIDDLKDVLSADCAELDKAKVA